MEQNRFPRI